jgi:hypothetical protein
MQIDTIWGAYYVSRDDLARLDYYGGGRRDPWIP